MLVYVSTSSTHANLMEELSMLGRFYLSTCAGVTTECFRTTNLLIMIAPIALVLGQIHYHALISIFLILIHNIILERDNFNRDNVMSHDRSRRTHHNIAERKFASIGTVVGHCGLASSKNITLNMRENQKCSHQQLKEIDEDHVQSNLEEISQCMLVELK